jgi:predicted nucleic acid-binding protein
MMQTQAGIRELKAQLSAYLRQVKAVGTSLISRAEMAAALDKAVCTGTLTREEAALALQVFRSEWPDLVRVQATETLVARADGLAWELGLRGYDAVHLASALLWQDSMSEQIVMATFDRQLWEAARRRGLLSFPDDLPGTLDAWRQEGSP